jgi:anti-sigma B factor antagonist
MADPARAIAVDERPDAAVVHVRGDIDAGVADQLRSNITAAGDRCGHIVLDLTHVSTVDATGLGMLVRAHRTARRHHGLVCLVAPSRFVVTVLHTMHLHRVFPIFEDCPSALLWLRQMSTADSLTGQVDT